MATINEYYVEPWSGWNLNLRDWYVPTLISEFKARSYLSQMVPLRVDPSTLGTKKMIWTGIYPLEPTWNAIDDVSWWLSRMYPSGYQIEVTMESFGEGMGLHKYHPLVTFWKAGGGQGALRQITRTFVVDAMVKQIERQVLNAYLSKPHYVIQGGGTGFSNLDNTDTYNITVAADIGLDLEYMEVIPSGGGVPVQACYLSPGQAHAIRRDDTNWVGLQKYTEAGFQRIMNWEIGAYTGVGRFMRHPINTLYCHGTQTATVRVTAAINPGDGAVDPATSTVDGARLVGQKTAGSVTPTRYIQLGSVEGKWNVGWDTDLATSMAKFLVGDIVAIGTVQSDGGTPPYDVQYAPLPTDGTLCFRQIMAVDTANGRLTFDKPIQKAYTTEAAGDCDAGEYAIVFKGYHVHVALHVAKPGGVVGAFADPPKVMTPAPFDDRNAQFRVTWDGVYGYALFQPENFFTVFSSGQVSVRGYKRFGYEVS